MKRRIGWFILLLLMFLSMDLSALQLFPKKNQTETFDFRNVKWGYSRQQVILAEGKMPDHDYDYDNSCVFSLENNAFFDEIEYNFNEYDQLVAASYEVVYDSVSTQGYQNKEYYENKANESNKKRLADISNSLKEKYGGSKNFSSTEFWNTYKPKNKTIIYLSYDLDNQPFWISGNTLIGFSCKENGYSHVYYLCLDSDKLANFGKQNQLDNIL